MLVGCIPTGHITVATASCPQARVSQKGNRALEGPSLSGWHFLPHCPGTFARWSHQTLMQCSPPLRGALPWFPPRWPFVLRSYLISWAPFELNIPEACLWLHCTCCQPNCLVPHSTGPTWHQQETLLRLARVSSRSDVYQHATRAGL